MLEGEAVEFDIKIDDKSGKESAVNVTGPNGAPVIGSENFFHQGGGSNGGDYGDRPRRPSSGGRRERRTDDY